MQGNTSKCHVYCQKIKTKHARTRYHANPILQERINFIFWKVYLVGQSIGIEEIKVDRHEIS